MRPRSLVCTKCGGPKNETNKRYHPWCTNCFNEDSRSRSKNATKDQKLQRSRGIKKRQLRNKLWLVTYLEAHPCVDCGEEDIVVLEFDHVRGVKKDNLANMLTGTTALQRIKEEVQKCEVVCRNCHMRRTVKRGNWWKCQYINRKENIYD